MSSGFPSQPPSGGTSGANQSDMPRPSSNESAQRPPQQTKLVDTRCCSGDANNTNHSYKENYANHQQGMLLIILYGNIDLPNCVCLSLFLILYIELQQDRL